MGCVCSGFAAESGGIMSWVQEFDAWIEPYRENLEKTGRFETMSLALGELGDMSGSHTLVETGCIRMKDDWGAGMSTYVFGSFCKKFGHHLYTVDISLDNINLCKEVTKEFEDVITYTVSDSISYLHLFEEEIDFLYLDSMDCPVEDDPTNPILIASQKHQLNELKTAIPKLSEDAIILLDDCGFKNGGKGKLTREYLRELNTIKELKFGYQSLWG